MQTTNRTAPQDRLLRIIDRDGSYPCGDYSVIHAATFRTLEGRGEIKVSDAAPFVWVKA